MSKYLEALKLLYGDSENISDSPEPRTAVTAVRAFGSNGSSTYRDINLLFAFSWTDIALN